MKLLILIAIFTGLAGFILDLYSRLLENKITTIDRIKALLLLLNIPVYAVGGSLMFLAYQVPLFHNSNWVILFYFLGGIICCLVELGAGYILNIKLKLNIWNYTLKITIFGKEIPLNILGQTDLVHFALFTLLTIPAINLLSIIEWLAR